MKLQTVRTILDAAMENQQHGVIKFGNDSVDFSFTAGDSSERTLSGITARRRLYRY